MTKLTHVKWAGPNTPMIKLTENERKLVLSKRELLDLQFQISAFLEFYKEDFEEPNIDYKDIGREDQFWHPYQKE